MRWRKLLSFVALISTLICLAIIDVAADDTDASLGEFCERIKSAMMNDEDEVVVSDLNIHYQNIDTYVHTLTWEYPEISFALSEDMTYTYNQTTSAVTTIQIPYLDKNSFRVKYQWLDTQSDNIISMMDEKWTDIQKLLWINDYICDNFRYDIGGMYSTAYDMLRHKQGICKGYVTLCNLLAKKCGIQISYCYSTDLAHIWNLVKIDGEWYNLDVTWNDNYSSRYEFFLLSEIADRAARNNHTFVCYKKHPANSTKYDRAFWRNNLYSSFAFVGSSTYGIINSYLVNVDLKNMNYQKLFPLQVTNWSVASNQSGAKKYYDLTAIGNILIYNTASDVYAYSLQTKKLAQLYRSPSNNIVSVNANKGGSIFVGMCHDILSDNFEIIQSPMKGIHTVSYKVDSKLYAKQYYLSGESLVYPAKPEESYYTFQEWGIDEGSIINQDLTIIASITYTASPCTIIFMVDGMEYYRTVAFEGSVIQPPNLPPVKEDNEMFTYTFVGWDGYSDGARAKGSEMIFYANYTSTPKIYKVNFYYGDSLIVTIPVEAGSTFSDINGIPQMDDATHGGAVYVFSGWDGAPDIVLSDTDVYAKYATDVTMADSAKTKIILIVVVVFGLFAIVLPCRIFFKQDQKKFE